MIAERFPLLMELNLASVVVRLLMAMLCGGIIGIDRGRKHYPAGWRTHMLVCLGAALVMITNQYICEMYETADPARLGAQVISGIGFLCAGTIIITRHQQVRGLTTAAGLWCSACMGLTIGVGYYEGAIVTCLLLIFIVVLMHRLDSHVLSNSRVMEMYVEMEASAPLSVLLAYLSNHAIQVNHVEVVHTRDIQMAGSAVVLTVYLPKKINHMDILDALRKVEGVVYIMEV